MEWFDGELACLCCCCRWVAEIRALSVRMVSMKERGYGSHFYSALELMQKYFFLLLIYFLSVLSDKIAFIYSY